MTERVQTNARKLAEKYRRRARILPDSIDKRLREAAKAVNREQVRNLSGPKGHPGSYPVPVETGDLRSQADFGAPPATSGYAVVFNTSGHAVPVHEGKGSSRPYGRRPFLDDAAETVDPLRVIREGVIHDLMAI